MSYKIVFASIISAYVVIAPDQERDFHDIMCNYWWKVVENVKFMYNISFLYQGGFLWQYPSGSENFCNMQNKRHSPWSKNFQVN